MKLRENHKTTSHTWERRASPSLAPEVSRYICKYRNNQSSIVHMEQSKNKRKYPQVQNNRENRKFVLVQILCRTKLGTLAPYKDARVSAESGFPSLITRPPISSLTGEDSPWSKRKSGCSFSSFRPNSSLVGSSKMWICQTNHQSNHISPGIIVHAYLFQFWHPVFSAQLLPISC